MWNAGLSAFAQPTIAVQSIAATKPWPALTTLNACSALHPDSKRQRSVTQLKHTNFPSALS
jgi:hypothetical protein